MTANLALSAPGRKANPRCTPTEVVEFYDSLKMQNVSYPSALLADEMNQALLRALHGVTYTCALNRLGFKIVEWIKSIEFFGSMRRVAEGERAGYKRDNKYFGEMTNI